ncbi:MAG: chloride channel protein [Eggerthellaceae bacterium]|nr:chloride channel protein [Eggerthellaceae bacterium]
MSTMLLKIKNFSIYLLFVFVLGFVAGAFVWAFFFVMDLGIEAVWQWAPSQCNIPFYPVIICALGGLLCGLYERRVGPLPAELSTVMAQVKRDGSYPYDRMGQNCIAALIPLLFGGSVGPEAGLTGVIAGLCSWVSDRMKVAKLAITDLASAGVTATLGAVFNAPFFAFVAPYEDGHEGKRFDKVSFPGKRKLCLNIIAIVGACTAYFILKMCFGEQGGLYRFGRTDFVADQLVWAIPLCIIGVFAGLFYQVCTWAMKHVGNHFQSHLIARAIGTGIILGLIGMVLPYTMFAGETQMETIVVGYGSIAAAVLIVTGFVKLLVGPMCIYGGWRGGTIFPVIFSGVAIGLGASMLMGVDPAFACAIVCGALCGVIMRKPLTVIMLLILCFPLQLLVLVAPAAVIGSMIPQLPFGTTKSVEHQ